MLEKIKPQFQKLIEPICVILDKLNIHPNFLTILGVIICTIGSYFIVVGQWTTAVIIITLGEILDGLDGVLARISGKVSKFGSILDSICDRVIEIIGIGAIMIFYINNPTMGPHYNIYLVYLITTGGMLISYIRGRAEGAGLKCNGGLMQKAERALFLAICLLLGPEAMNKGLIIITVLIYMTVLQRIYIVYKSSTKSN